MEDVQDYEENDISSSSADDESSGNFTAKSTNVEDQAEKELRETIIKREESHVRAARWIVTFAISACALAVSVSVFFLARLSDFHSFELEYEGYVKDIKSLVQWEVQQNFALMQQMSASLTSAALNTEFGFPYFTWPQFEIGGGYVDGMSGIMVCAFAPLIKAENKLFWELYSVQNQGWLEESARLKAVHSIHRDPLHGTIQDHEDDRRLQDTSIREKVWRWESGEKVIEVVEPGDILAPLWQLSPAAAPTVNVNLFSDERVVDLYNAMLTVHRHDVNAATKSLISAPTKIKDLFDFAFDPHEKPRKENPHGFFIEPVYDTFSENPDVVGFLLALTSWENLFDRLLPENADGIVCVITDTCNNTITYQVNGPKSTFMGWDDLHDPVFEEFRRSTQIELFMDPAQEGVCVHHLHIYPSAAFKSSYETSRPAIYTAVVAAAFVVTSLLLVVYDRLVTRRQEKTMASAIRTNALVSTIFPATVRDRVMNKNQTDKTHQHNVKNNRGFTIKDSVDPRSSTPIADFFPATTIMFADITGFTAWSSTHEPTQVFYLLETIYGAFDKIAKRRRVFKVETVGDCYVAAAGVPTPRKDHFLVMARFARDCHFKMRKLTHELESVLGPDTANLSFRIGLHSGPVTAGVLRGDNARFQLFGDTMNMAARMESTGAGNQIHLSKETADLIVASGRDSWVKPRQDLVHAKGKGDLQTYWLELDDTAISRNSSSFASSDESFDRDARTLANPTSNCETQSNLRLINWNVSVLLERLKAVEAERRGVNTIDVQIDPDVEAQLYQYVSGIEAKYRVNPFHNFEHASHVTMSVTKLLSRVLSNAADAADGSFHKDIASDAMTQFAVVFSALIHDVDHTGVSNAQLVSEKNTLAIRYDNKSIAEYNSIAVALDLWAQPEFRKLRTFLCPKSGDHERFTKLVVQTVLATDIVDSDLKDDRNMRWNKVFGPTHTKNANQIKAGIVLEHLIQASDVCHTMQHWYVYLKWNERLFAEMYKAYKAGRLAQHPADSWYQGEIGFFDFYIIPLAKKLEDCGVFGVSSDEFVNYAEANRLEWERKGQQIVNEFVAKYCDE